MLHHSTTLRRLTRVSEAIALRGKWLQVLLADLVAAVVVEERMVLEKNDVF